MNKILMCVVWLILALLVSTGSISAHEENTTEQIISGDDALNIPIENPPSLKTTVYDLNDSGKLSTNTSDLKNSANKNPTELTSQKTDIYYQGTYSVILKDLITNNALANKKVNFVINDINYSSISDINGIAGIQLSQMPGQYTISAYFEGDGDYFESNNLTENINILNTIQAGDITKYYTQTTLYTAVFFTSTGERLANTDVIITVDGKAYTVKTTNDSVAALSLNLKPKDYTIVSQNPLTGIKLSNTIKILSTISANNIEKVYTDGRKFTAKFLKSDGKALANTYVKFKLKGKTYKVKTNGDGVGKLSVKNLKQGTHTIISQNNDGLEQTNTIKVYKKVSSKLETKRYTFLKSESKTVKVKLVHALGYSPQSGKIIKFTINGKKYSKKTNNDGIAQLKLPNLKLGVYTIKYSFAGTSCYKASGVQNKVEIISTKNPKFTVKSTKTFIPNSNAAFKVKLTAGNVALEKRTVTFNINGAISTKTTNKDGSASIPINLALGKYKVIYSVNKEDKINAKTDSCTIDVKQKVESSILWKSDIIFSPGKKTLKVLLVDNDGKAISAQKIKLTAKSKTYSSKTSSNGYAKFSIKLAKGSYKITVRYGGNANYYASSVKKSISVIVPGSKNINDVNTIKNLKAYLKASPNCQVGDAKIKELVKKIISGYSSKKDKAKAIFGYVRDTLYYDFYFNTKYGALGTLISRTANCADHSHLLVAMFRTAGIHARYVHGTCKFNSGKTYGHVWSQVLIGNKWMATDPTCSKNTVGKIYNWNTKTFTVHSKPAGIYF